MNPESLIFDIDGTLWDSRALFAQGYNIQLRAEGLGHLAISPEDFLAVFGKPTDQIADGVFPTVPKPVRYALIARCIERAHAYMAGEPCRVGYPGIRETMEKLAAKYRLFLVSNCECGYPEICAGKLGITPYLTDTLCYGQTKVSKGETIRRLMAKHRIESAVYIGDTQGDLDSAEQAGIPFIWASYGFGTVTHYAAKIDSFPELISIL